MKVIDSHGPGHAVPAQIGRRRVRGCPVLRRPVALACYAGVLGLKVDQDLPGEELRLRIGEASRQVLRPPLPGTHPATGSASDGWVLFSVSAVPCRCSRARR